MRWFLVFSMIFVSVTGQSAEPQWLEVEDRVAVYPRPELGTPAMYLEAGATVPLSRKRYGNGRFYRVIVNFRGRKRGGYILVSDVDSLSLEEADSADPNFTRRPENDWRKKAWGISLGYQMLKQGSGETEASSGQLFQVSEVSGSVQSASLFWDFPVEESWNVRTYFTYRQFKLDGSASISGSAQTTDFDKEQTMLSLGMIFRLYWNVAGKFWYGGGMEIGKTLSSKLKFSTGTIAEADAGDIPLRVIVSANLGYDIVLSKTWQIVPEISFGTIANDDPISLLLQSQLSLRTSF